MGMFFLTLQKIPVSLSFIVTEIWPRQNTNPKSGFLAKTSKFLGKSEFWFFCCTTLVGILSLEFFANFLHERRYGSDKVSVTDKRTDARTDIHGGKNNICLPQGETYNNRSRIAFQGFISSDMLRGNRDHHTISDHVHKYAGNKAVPYSHIFKTICGWYAKYVHRTFTGAFRGCR